MHRRKAALAACAALSTLALASCGLPGLGGGTSDAPVSRVNSVPRAASPAVPSAAAPSASDGATTAVPAPAAGMTPMKRPTKPFAQPRYPKGPNRSAPSTDQLIYNFEKLVWKAAGTADPKTTSGKCGISEVALNKKGVHKFICTITYNGVAVPVGVTYTTGTYYSPYDYKLNNYPLTRAKAEYSAMYSAYNGVAVACDMKADTVSVQVDDEQGVLCHVQGSDGDVVDYYLQMSSYGSVYGSRA